MANNAGFSVTITAVDKATDTIKKINQQFSKFTKPVTDLQRAMTKLSKDTGLDKLKKSLSGAADAAVGAFDKFGKLDGLVGGLAGVGSVGGLAVMARQWADVGQEASNAAYRIGVTTDQLQRYRGVARLAGVSDQAMTQGAASMAKNIGDVLSGRNPTMAGYFAQLGIRARYDAQGRPDVAGAYADVGRALQNAPTTQGKNAILDALGQPEELRPVIENMTELNGQMAAMRPNAGAAAQAGTELNKSMSALGENAGGVADNIETTLSPGLKKVVDWLDQVAAAANTASQSGVGKHVATVGVGAVTGAATGAVTGAAVGALFGGIGAVPGAIGGAVIGGLGGGALAGGVDVLGNAGGEGGGQSVSAAIPPFIKRNNPGNLRVPGQNAFQSFDTPDSGLVAAAKQLIRDRNVHGLNTISGIVGSWAPPNENDTAGYTRGVSDDTGLLPSAALPNDQSTNASVLSAIVKREQGGKQPFTPEQYAQAVAAAMQGGGGQKGEITVTVNGPPGTTATAASGNQYWPVRLHYGMPTGAVNP